MSEFAGLTQKDCCADCHEGHCVISGMAVCGHPFKSNLNASGPEVVERIVRARKLIAIQKAGGAEETSHAVEKPSPARVRRNVVHRRRKAKTAGRRKKADARSHGAGISEGGQGPQDQPAGEARP